MNNSLENKKIKISFEDGKEISVKYKTTVEEVLILTKTEAEMKEILGAKFNNEVITFEQELVSSGTLITLNYESLDGRRIYMRTVKFILFMAIERLYPDLDIDFSNNIDDNGYFISKNREFTPLMAVNILKEMREIVKKGSKIERKSVPYEEARVLFEYAKDARKLKSTRVKLDSHMTLYFCEDLYNSMYGVLAPNTSLTPDFDIKVFRKGFLLMNPEDSLKENPKKKITGTKLYDIFEEYSKISDYVGVKSVSDLNARVINDDTDEIIKVSEAVQNNKMAELLKDISSNSNTKVILIAGPSSSGKTTFAGKLGINLKTIGYKPVVIGMDNYYRDLKDRFNKETGNYECESVSALDINLFNSHIKNLLLGKKIKMPAYNFLTGEREYKGQFLQLGEKDILIIEGIHALNPIMTEAVDEKYKYKIYIAPITTLNLDDYSKISATDTRIIRRIVRDYNTRGLNVDTTFSMWSEVMKGEKTYIYPYVDSVDYIFNSSLMYEIGALKTFADPLLLQVEKENKYFSEARRLYGILKNFLAIDTSNVPDDSLLREFIGKR